MAQEKVVFFLDYANINRAAREKRYRLDYYHMLQYVGEERFLIDAHCYVPINPRNEHRLDRDIQDLWRSGYIVTTKIGTIAGGTYKCNFDVEITMDILKVVYQVKPDIIVLASGDSDFVSLIQDVRKAGIRVEVAAFEETAGPDMMQKCSGFINLDVYYEGYLAAQHSERGENSRAQQDADLIHSQNSEQHGDGKADQDTDLIHSQNSEQSKDGKGAEQDEDLLHPYASDLQGDDVTLPGDPVGTQIPVSVPDIIDELDV
ncbi:MAG: NYN domain-containing protein [Ktedonobacteraceae bacterium]